MPIRKSLVGNSITVVGDSAEIPIRNRKGEVVAVTLIDICDVPSISGFSLNYKKPMGCPASGYVVVYMGGSGRYALLHRFICNAPAGLVVDHINGDGLDNRRQNLRVVSQIDNAINRTRVNINNSSGYRCVYRTPKTKKFHIYVHYAGRRIRENGFVSAEAAAVRVTEILRECGAPEANLNIMQHSQDQIITARNSEGSGQ